MGPLERHFQAIVKYHENAALEAAYRYKFDKEGTLPEPWMTEGLKAIHNITDLAEYRECRATFRWHLCDAKDEAPRRLACS